MESEEYNKLTEKQKRFIDFYIETGNASKASEMAGYNGNNLNTVGAQNYAKLSKFINEKLEKKETQRIASQEEVLEYLTKVMRGEEKDQFGLDASLQDRTKCAELLGKRYGTFKDNVNVTGKIPVVIEDDIPE